AGVALGYRSSCFPYQLSSSATDAGLSSQPPAPSGTSSTSSMRSPWTAVTRPSFCPMYTPGWIRYTTLSGATTSPTIPLPRPIVPTMSRLSSGNCSSVCLRRCESGRGPLPVSFDVNASLNGSRRPSAAYSKVSNCCITGSGSSGGAGLALMLATHSSRFGASPGVLVIPRPQAPSASARPSASAPRAMVFDIPMSVPSPDSCGIRLFGGLVLVQVAVGLHRAGQFEAGVGTDRGRRILAGVHRPQRDVVHGHDDHARQRGHAADEGTELVVGAHHLQRDRLLGVELLGRLRTGLEQLVLDAGGQRGLGDVDDQVGHLGLARQLAQHLLQLLLHLRELLLERLEVGAATLLELEFTAQFGFALLE